MKCILQLNVRAAKACRVLGVIDKSDWAGVGCICHVYVLCPPPPSSDAATVGAVHLTEYL